MKITLLVDDQVTENLQNEFGLALLLESAVSGSWLFDTGAATALEYNIKKLNIPENKLKRVILSHGHYDHSGGLARLAPEKIYAPMGCAVKRYSYHGNNDIHDISMPADAAKILRSSEVHYSCQCEKIADDLYLTGFIPHNSFEDTGGRFFYSPDCSTPDRVGDEQSLVTADGILISGCCHAGLINTLEHCRKVLPQINIHTAVGGLHLRKASAERLQKTAEYLRRSQIRNLYLMHCTGENAIQQLQTLLPECTVHAPHPGESWECQQ